MITLTVILVVLALIGVAVLALLIGGIVAFGDVIIALILTVLGIKLIIKGVNKLKNK